ncbi:hypothetical protein [Actinoplanes sp. NPDC049265]|uniref:hypothetical protein n=1 Tax=Actinoplanes sp. NPDC049265 TaxID=3363902 RepID=UPI003720FD87
MANGNSHEEYWSLDIPGLTAVRSQSLKDRLDPEFDYGVIPTNPRLFMTRSYDLASVEILVRCLRAALNEGSLAEEDTSGASALLEDCEAWIQQAGG